MSNDDSRGLETPDRSHEPPTNLPDNSSALTDAARLEVIDRLAAELLTSVEESDADHRDLKRHYREIRAEVESARRVLEDDALVTDRGPGCTSWLGPDPAAFTRHGGADDE
ncbi:hypothetical protein ACYJ1Y_07345 [Natrialbaceae archaeon A-gly3]